MSGPVTLRTVTNPIADLGRATARSVAGFGDFVVFCGSALLVLFTNPRRWADPQRLVTQLYLVGTRSAPVLALTGAFIGAVLAIEGFDQFSTFGIEDRLGAVVNISILKQIGPVLAAVMVAGRVGCSLAAELGSMRVTQQLDAMRVMAASPIRVLVVPRVLACVVMIPALTVIANLCGIFGGWLFIVIARGVPNRAYWVYSVQYVDWYDVMSGLVKALLFGLAIGLISCFKGFTCRPGAQGVGRATTDAFVVSFLAIVVINLVLAKLLNDVEPFINPAL